MTTKHNVQLTTPYNGPHVRCDNQTQCTADHTIQWTTRPVWRPNTLYDWPHHTTKHTNQLTTRLVWWPNIWLTTSYIKKNTYDWPHMTTKNTLRLTTHDDQTHHKTDHTWRTNTHIRQITRDNQTHHTTKHTCDNQTPHKTDYTSGARILDFNNKYQNKTVDIMIVI